MQKKQPSHILSLYIFCILLIVALAFSFVLSREKHRDDDFYGAEEVVIEKPEGKALPQEITAPGTMKKLRQEASELSTLFAGEEQGEDYFANPFSVFTELETAPPNRGIGITYAVPPEEAPLVVKPAEKPKIANQGAPSKVVIIIDDMGISRKWSRKMAQLKAPLTLSYLPYAKDLQAQVDFARMNKHHIMLHMPMEAMGGAMASTPGLLTVNTTQNEFLSGFQNNLDSFEGFYGVNNHMGSRLTQDRTKMNLVMTVLKEEGLYFIDSRTIHSSVAANAAQESGVPFLIRDVFLDHENDIDYVRGALARLERIALESDYAIAIGHPKEATYLALKEWLPTLKDKNIELVSSGDIIHQAYPNVQLQAYKPMNGSTLLVNSR